MKASELVEKALRLINVPGRGAKLNPADQANALDSLQDLLASEAVSSFVVPGVRRHFFGLQPGKSIYIYGAGPQANFRSDDFDDDSAPIGIESAYIRSGSNIINNEVIGEPRFENLGPWVLGGNGSVISNNALSIEKVVDTATQSLTSSALVAGQTYTLRINADVFSGTVEIRARDSAVVFDTYILDSQGYYEFDFVWATTVAPDIQIATTDSGDDIRIDSISLIERGKVKLELPDGQGTDYPVTVIDQKRYNRRSSKGTSGRPYEMHYSRGYKLSNIRFESSAQPGDILVMDVLVNPLQVNNLNSEIKLNPEAMLWLRYALADIVAPEHAKALTPRQIKILDKAWDNMASTNHRPNKLRADPAIQSRRHYYDINQGDT